MPASVPKTCPILAPQAPQSLTFGQLGMEKNMETTIMGYIGSTKRIHSFIPSSQEVRNTLPKSKKFGPHVGGRKSCGRAGCQILQQSSQVRRTPMQ